MHKCLLLTDILHIKTLIEIGDVVLAAQLHAVEGPNGCVVSIEETLPVRINVLGTLFPMRSKSEGKREKAKEEIHFLNSFLKTIF